MKSVNISFIVMLYFSPIVTAMAVVKVKYTATRIAIFGGISTVSSEIPTKKYNTRYKLKVRGQQSHI